MDGNGRWAKARGLPRTEGHREGLKAAKRVVAAAEDLGVKWLSLYTFSTENWKRAAEEVSFLMALIRGHLRAEFDFYRERGLRVVHSGDSSGLPGEVRAELDSVVADTASFDRMTVNLAINYGGRDEIVRACRKAVREDVELTETTIANRLDRPELPDLDLLIRTGGEQRTSNFMIWQAAYAELWFSPRLWPDWDRADLEQALDDYTCRERRFGGVP
ncbi:MAG: di-trans,poly-cis-decaprenylcistransferase [Spirochaetales bacterium]|nr:di-trans,poly-cis-decaprenylcistransferase [Spirochaetales bacterium]